MQLVRRPAVLLEEQEVRTGRVHGASGGAEGFGDPLALLRSYYAAINNRDLARAYTYWSNDGAASKQNFTQFSQGFATTDHVVIDNYDQISPAIRQHDGVITVAG